MRFENLSDRLFAKTEQCLAAAAEFFGMFPGNSLLSTRGLFSLLSLAAAFVLFYYAVRLVKGNEQKFVPVFFLASSIFNVFIFIIVNESVISRYFIPFMIFYIPLAAIGFSAGEKTRGNRKRAAVFSAALLFVFGSSFLNYMTLAKNDRNAERKGYIEYLLENHLDYGFATFWNANVTTELSGGAVELAGLKPGSLDNGRSDFRIHLWLNPVQFYNPAYHEGESFLLLTTDEWEKAKAAGRYFVRNTPDYEDEHFIVMRFPSAQIIHRDVLDP